MSNSPALIDFDALDRYEETVSSFLQGNFDKERFVAQRLLLGVYGQRQEGLCMVRSKLPGGRLRADQLAAFAEALERFSKTDVVHLSTRQNIQFHHIPVGDTPELLRILARADITSREAGGNTVRNITSCPLAGVCPKEHTDITPHLEASVGHFVGHPLTEQLPRKFKTSFSGCEADCANGAIHDLGVIATRKDGQPGFKLLVGGGLGSKPLSAITITEFIPETELLPAFEAVVSLHHRFSDRKRRSRSRIKFLVERFGEAELIRLFEEELDRTRAAFGEQPTPQSIWHRPTEIEPVWLAAPRNPVAQRQADRLAVPVHIPHGDINAFQLRGLSKALVELGIEELRVTQDQNLVILNVPTASLSALEASLAALQLALPKAGEDVVACPGTSTCQLGITSSTLIARLLSGGDKDLRIRVNGCHNGCAQSETADIGLYGKGKRHFGRLVPSYAIQLGGSGRPGDLAFNGPEVPAVRVQAAVKRIQDNYVETGAETSSFQEWARAKDKDFFGTLLADLSRVTEFELPMLLRDHGDSEIFKVEHSGPGECAGAKEDPVTTALSDAAYEQGSRDAFVAKRKVDDALESQQSVLYLTGKALLLSEGDAAGVGDLDALLAPLKAALGSDALVIELADLSHQLKVARDELDELLVPPLLSRADEWQSSAAELARQKSLQNAGGILPPLALAR